ncbi:hypothetical protein V5799_022580 [Amblyomma americanum]|uniref:THAP-type domain-containing protein n=1 Tax=Amblyomma americanum TaxID=6943 RepID=A0AAQ4FM50_AMBAM
MVQCCVPFCKSTPGPKVPYSFHEFPVTRIRLEWIRRISRKANGPKDELWLPSDRSKVCSLHFREEDFRRDLKKRRLLPDAVPSIFPGYPTAMQEARHLSPPQKSEKRTAALQLLGKRPKGHDANKQRAPKKRLLENAMPGASVDSVPPADESAAGTLLKPAKKALQKATASAQRTRPKSICKKVLQVTATSPSAELGEGKAFFCRPIVSASGERGRQTSSVPGKRPLPLASTSSMVSCPAHPAVSSAVRVAPVGGSGTLPTTALQPVTSAPGCRAPSSRANPAENNHAACIQVPAKAPPSVVTTRTVPKLAARAGQQLLPAVDSLTAAKELSSKRKLAPVVVVDAKKGTFKPLMLCSKPLSSTKAPLTGKLLTVGRLLKCPKNKPVVTGSSATAGQPKIVLPQQSAAASKQISRGYAAGATTKLITEKQSESSSCFVTINGFGGHLAASNFSASSSQHLTPDCMVAAGQSGSRPLKRTVGSQTLLTKPRLQHLCQRLKTLQRKCLKLQTQKQQLQQELSSTRLEARKAQTFIRELRLTQFKERVASGDARCLFLEEQLRCLDQTKHRWREETLQCCLMWHTLSPRGYRIISQSGLLSLPSCSTLKRHVDAVGNGPATTRGPPSPTGDTVPSAEDVMDMEDAMAGVKAVVNASIDDRLGASSRTVVLSNSRRVSGSQDGEGVDHFVKACIRESTEECNQSVCMKELPAACRCHAGRKGLGAESSAEQAGEQMLQLVYVKPSDILDNVEEVAPTELLPVSAVDQYVVSEATDSGVKEEKLEGALCGGAGSVEEATNVCPTVKPTETPSCVPERSPSVSVQVSTSAKVAGLKSHAPCPKPSRKAKVPFPKTGKAVPMATCSGDHCQPSRILHASPESLAGRAFELASEKDLLESSPPRDLTELLNIVGTSVPPKATASVIDASVDSETRMPAVDLHDTAVELPLLPVVPSSPASIQGSLGDEAQALKVIYTDAPAVEDVQCEALNEVVSATLREPGGEAGQVFQIVYICTAAAADQ